MPQNDNLNTHAHKENQDSLVDSSSNLKVDVAVDQKASATNIEKHSNELHVHASSSLMTNEQKQPSFDALEDMHKRNLATAMVVSDTTTHDIATASGSTEQSATTTASGNTEQSATTTASGNTEQSATTTASGSTEQSATTTASGNTEHLDVTTTSGSAVQILNKIIEVVEDEEVSSSDEVKIVRGEEQKTVTASVLPESLGDDTNRDTINEAKPDLTIAEPEAVIDSGFADADNESSYPELSAADQERYNKMLLKEGDQCPACGKGTLILRQNERVAFLGCSCFPQCKLRYYTARSNAVVTLKILESACPECGAKLAVKKGRYGLFIGCSDYPQCTYTFKEDTVDEQISCPICQKGQLERRRARSGRIFFGCNNYPSCEFIVPGVPVASECKECGFPLKYKKKVKAGTALICANPLCASRRRRKQELIKET